MQHVFLTCIASVLGVNNRYDLKKDILLFSVKFFFVQELEELFQLHSVEELLLLLIKVVENDFDVFPFPDVFPFVFLD